MAARENSRAASAAAQMLAFRRAADLYAIALEFGEPALGVVGALLGGGGEGGLGDVLQGLYGLGVLVPGIAVTVRRLHDIGKSGWWGLVALIPLIGSLILIYFAAKDSQPETNEYGPNPKAASI